VTTAILFFCVVEFPKNTGHIRISGLTAYKGAGRGEIKEN
jgi:hypothetical protein